MCEDHLKLKGRTIIFLEGGGGVKNIEINCLQGLERQNKLFANTICITKNSKNFEKQCLQRKIFHPPQENNGPSLIHV